MFTILLSSPNWPQWKTKHSGKRLTKFRARFSHFLRHPARKRMGLILILEPGRNGVHRRLDVCRPILTVTVSRMRLSSAGSLTDWKYAVTTAFNSFVSIVPLLSVSNGANTSRSTFSSHMLCRGLIYSDWYCYKLSISSSRVARQPLTAINRTPAHVSSHTACV